MSAYIVNLHPFFLVFCIFYAFVMFEKLIFACMLIRYRYSELQRKNKTQATEKDEQLEEMRQKVDSVSLELRKCLQLC